MDQSVRTLLEGAVRLLREELSAGLIGIYAHGSLAMGGFNPMRSDIDLLVVVREPSERHTYRRIADKLLRLEEEQPVGAGIELSIVLEAYAAAFVHPTPFEFHYSAHHRSRYKEEADYVCGGTADPDLAAHFAVTYSRGVALWGQPVRELTGGFFGSRYCRTYARRPPALRAIPSITC
ncbi:nucleotidyltransferase domain-containing protein [Paenibacillus glycinis]|uniref:nucleotidyltransferase domain-containing protein n=1 Tax=Paenibacillus glycinis TaxID=2697035 RepID=UPI001F2BD647|nr:nucleotidyltransferase domain-containing protein [Paenibacillus glycinis]